VWGQRFFTLSAFVGQITPPIVTSTNGLRKFTMAVAKSMAPHTIH